MNPYHVLVDLRRRCLQNKNIMFTLDNAKSELLLSSAVPPEMIHLFVLTHLQLIVTDCAGLLEEN